MANNDAEINKERNNFLSACHTLKFSETNTEDQTEIVDIKRRSLAAKYLSARQFESVDMASRLLGKGLADYQTLMENKAGVNNYWKQVKAQSQQVGNAPQKWTTGLQDISVALNFVKPLTCQEDNTLPCKGKILADRDIESITNTWKNRERSSRNRKVSVRDRSRLGRSSVSDNKINLQNINVQSESKHSSFPLNHAINENGRTQTSCTKKQLPTSYPAKHETQTLTRQQSINFERKVQSTHGKDLSSNSIFNPARSIYDQMNCGKNNGKSKSAILPQRNDEDTTIGKHRFNSFKTAKEEFSIQQAKANKAGYQKKTLGGKGGIHSQFVCPLKGGKEKQREVQENLYDAETDSGELEDERLRNIDPKMVELIRNEIMDSRTTICWDDIAGLEYAKKIIKEVVVYPMLRPDIFTGLRRPPKGILLFGPPGTGKTLIGKCIASQSKSTFFSISASSLTSKWIGEGEKMVRALFAVARVYQPSVIFVDEIDSLLTQRSETEHESSRRMKTEFLVQLDGAATADEDRILIVGATNRPQELDEAARRRLVKRLYVPLPELQARRQIINNLLITISHNLSDQDVIDVAEQSKGYSGADMSNLCKEASMGPIRSIPFSQLEEIRKEDVRQVTIDDFKEALIHVRPSVSESSLIAYVEWDSIYGTGTAQNYKV